MRQSPHILIGSSLWKSNHCHTVHHSQSHSPADCGELAPVFFWDSEIEMLWGKKTFIFFKKMDIDIYQNDRLPLRIGSVCYIVPQLVCWDLVTLELTELEAIYYVIPTWLCTFRTCITFAIRTHKGKPVTVNFLDTLSYCSLDKK